MIIQFHFELNRSQFVERWKAEMKHSYIGVDRISSLGGLQINEVKGLIWNISGETYLAHFSYHQAHFIQREREREN